MKILLAGAVMIVALTLYSHTRADEVIKASRPSSALVHQLDVADRPQYFQGRPARKGSK